MNQLIYSYPAELKSYTNWYNITKKMVKFFQKKFCNFVKEDGVVEYLLLRGLYRNFVY